MQHLLNLGISYAAQALHDFEVLGMERAVVDKPGIRKKPPLTSSYRNTTSLAVWTILSGGPMRGTPGGWHWSAVSRFT